MIHVKRNININRHVFATRKDKTREMLSWLLWLVVLFVVRRPPLPPCLSAPHRPLLVGHGNSTHQYEDTHGDNCKAKSSKEYTQTKK